MNFVTQLNLVQTKINLTVEEILISSDISEEDYFWALAISSDSDYQLHLKHVPNIEIAVFKVKNERKGKFRLRLQSCF